MRRREFTTALGFALTGSPVLGQTGRKLATIGFMGLGSPAVGLSRLASLRAGLHDLGYADGKDYHIEFRAVGADYAQADETATELVRLRPDVLVTQATPGTAALKRATSTIPIVTVTGDAVATGLIASLHRPGGNVTGITFFSPELMAKRLELLKEAVPNLQLAGVLASAANPVTRGALEALATRGETLGVRVRPALVREPDEIAPAFMTFEREGVTGLVVQDEPMIIANAKVITDLAAQRRLISVGFVEMAAQGSPIAYSIDFDELYRRAAQYVVKILDGADPRSLPVEQPTKFRLVLNLKAMRALGVEPSPALLARADEVIE